MCWLIYKTCDAVGIPFLTPDNLDFEDKGVWEDIANQNKNEARLLELTVNDFKNSNDSLIKVARDQQKKLKIKDKQLRQVASTETVIRDTTVRIIPSKEKDFCVELKPNQLTTITVARKDSVFTHTMEICI